MFTNFENINASHGLTKLLITSIFVSPEGSDLALCRKLFYDKVKDLGDYNLKMVTFNDSKLNRYDGKKSGYGRCESASLKIMCIMLEHIGATVTAKIHMYRTLGFK